MKSALRIVALAALVMLSACRDDSTAPPTVNEDPPASFRVEGPETIVQGQPFDLTITALDEAGLPQTTWSGSVTLSASAGTLAPATAQLASGTATVQVALGGHTGPVTLRANAGGAQSEPVATMVLSGAAPARLEIVPAAALLTSAGATQQFEVRAYDAQGAPTTAGQVSWSSTAPALSVDANGVATAQVATGSAQLVAEADGVSSAPALVLIAQPAASAVLLDDAQIVSDPVAVDAAAPYGPGWQYRIRVQNAQPEVGAIVIGTGQRPLAGRVVASDDLSDETELTVELIPLNQLFTDLLIDEEIPLIEVEGSGTSGEARIRRPAPRMPAAFEMGAETEFDLGPFSCKASGSLPSLDLGDETIDVRPHLRLAIHYDDGLRRLAVVGDVTAEASYAPRFNAAFEGKTTCEVELRTVTIPAWGVISYFYGVQVPVGLGFELEGKLEIAEIGFDISANATATIELGLSCPPGGGTCAGLDTFELTRDGELKFVAPDPEDDFHVVLTGQAFVFARPKLASLFTDALSFGFIDATAGLTQTVDLATTHKQAEDSTYASFFDLRFNATVEAGEDLTSAVDKLGDLVGMDISAHLPRYEVEDTLASSPRGTFTITPENVQPGDTTELGEMATFTVELDPVEYLGLYAVDKVEFFWRHDDSTGFTLGPARPSCVEVEGSSGKKKFECETDFLAEHRGKQTFHAFVHAELFGVPLPLPLEIAADARASVLVGCSGFAYPEQLYLKVDTTSDGRGTTYTHSASPHTYGDVGASLTADSEEGEYGPPRFSVTVRAMDGICATPQDTGLYGDTINLRVKLNGRIAVDPADNVEGSSAATVRFQSGVTFWAEDVMAQLHDEPRMIDETLDVPYVLGSWTYLSGEAYVWAGSSNGTSHAASAQLTYEIVGAFDSTGAEVPIREWITGSGHMYGLPDR